VTSAPRQRPWTSLKQIGCYCGREGFLCAGISEDELRYSCTASFQKTIWQTSAYKAVCLRLEQDISRNWLFMYHNYFCNCWRGYARVCLDRIRPSYWYLPCDKKLTYRTFV